MSASELLDGTTAEPWLDNLHAGEKREGGRFYVHVLANAAGIVPIACVPTGVEGYGRDEGRANARLIAAAPRLARENITLTSQVEALREASSALISDVRRRYPGEALRCEFMQALDAALASTSKEQG